MPQNYRSSWSEAGPAFQNAGNTIQDVVLGLAQQRYQMAQAQAQRQYQQAQMQQQQEQFQQTHALNEREATAREGHYRNQAGALGAQAGYDRQRTQGLQEQSDAGLVLGDVLQYMIENPQAPDINQFRGAAANRLSRIAATDPDSAVKSIFQALQINDPNEVANLAAGGLSNRRFNTPAGATTTGPNGEVIVEGAYNLGAGQQRYGAQTPGPQVGMSYNQFPQQPIAQGLPLPISRVDPTQQMLGTLGNIQGNYNAGPGGGLLNKDDPNRILVEQMIKQYLQQVQQQQFGTNAPRMGLADPNGVAAPPAKSKAMRANEIAAQNPTWTRQQVIDAVNKEMGQ